MKITGAEAIMRCLLEQGVDTIFGYPGGAIMPTYDALYGVRSEIRHILVRHEQGAAHAAQGYARITGRAGVCLVTSGPAATNLVTGIADAMMDSVPLVCLVGQVHRAFLGTDAFQEADVIGITMPITKWNYQITRAEEIPAVLAKAFYIAENGRPGPVVIDITKNAQADLIEFAYEPVRSLKNFDARPLPAAEALDAAAELINSARRPLALVGHGVLIAKAQRELSDFLDKSGVPVALTLHGLSAVRHDHPLYVGMLGMHGNYAPNLLTNQADLLIAIGMRFDDRVTGSVGEYARKAKIVHIDIDPAELGKIVPTQVSLNGDARDVLQELVPRLTAREHSAWRAEFDKHLAAEQEKVIEPEIHPREGQLRMGEVINLLSEKTAGEAVVVADVGQHQMMAARYYGFRKTDGYITSGGLGTMGFALPAAVGAKLAAPERQVVAIIGDGGFQMTIQELGTIAQEGLPVKALILNNNFLGMVRQWQELFFEKRYSFVDLKNPDFVAISKGFGVPAERVTSREQIGAALDRMLQSSGPYLVEVMVEKEQNVFPMVPAGCSVSDVRLE